MSKFLIERKNYSLCLEKTEDGVLLCGGKFGAVTVAQSTLFTMLLRNLESGEDITLTAETGWKYVRETEGKDYLRFDFGSPEMHADLMISVTLQLSERGVHFETEVSNLDERYSALETTYPIPQIENDVFDLFVTSGPGRVLRDIRHREYKWERWCPSAHLCMQYMAFMAEGDALYVGHHDRESRTKRYRLYSNEGNCSFAVAYPAENLGKGANSHRLRGGVSWEYVRGDWYDVTMRYAEFAHTADWIPYINEEGRPDTPKAFKELPFWVFDFLPNIPEQGNNMPESLRYAGITDKDAWWREGIRIKENLGVPIGYHVYNWHKIAFNVDYPHFLPAKDDFAAGVAKMKEKGILVAPYINSSSWESRDVAPDGSETFADVGFKCAAKDVNGHIKGTRYPQIKPDGERVNLVQTCPTTPTWQRIMTRLTTRLENELGVNGVYYDQSAADPALPCTDPTHPHAPGNSGAWADGIRYMMHRVRAGKPAENFSFTECNAEPYMNAFDGYLTWHWGDEDEVPAFPAVYSKYITMLGRVIKGVKKADKFLTRFTFITSLCFGQQIGWCNCDVQDDPTVFPLLKKVVKTRYALRDVFITGSMLRPPVITSNLPDHKTDKHIWTKNDIRMPSTVAGAWQSRDKSAIHIFLCNADEQAGECTVTLRASEYGITKELPAALAPYAPALDPVTDTLTLHARIKGADLLHITI